MKFSPKATFLEKEIRRGSNKTYHLSLGIYCTYLPAFNFVIIFIYGWEEH